MALAAAFDPQPLVGPPVDAEDLSALAYTGGTTGKPKGVIGTYRGSAAMAQIMVRSGSGPSEVRHLVCTPLSHAGVVVLRAAAVARRVDGRAARLRARRGDRRHRAPPDHGDHAGARP